jgi:hypothetical protein
MPSRLSLTPSFSKSAEKLGWTILNYGIQANSIILVQDDFRITFWIDEDETKMWDLHRYSSINGWHLVHRMIHPGTSRLDWVLKTAHRIMNIVSDEVDSSTKRKTPAKSTSKRRTINTILFVGVRRSGNHGLLNWLIGNLSGKVIHINALAHSDLTPEMYEKNSRKPDEKNPRKPDPRYPVSDSSGLEYSEGKWINFHHADWLILSLESVKIRQLKDKLVDFSERTKCKSVLLLRDPLNNAASMYKNKRSRGFTDEMARSSVGHVLVCWEQHAEEMVAEDSFWTTRILFNRWIIDQGFRDHIMSDMGLINSDSGFGKISGHGRSSFDQNQDDAVKLDLEGRYRSMISDQDFVNSVANKGVDAELWKSVCDKFSHYLEEEYLTTLIQFPKIVS